jgi:FAD/FMN-containing dehydrogenase/Fe-S oxidoreductase
VRGDVRFDAGSRALYATDASNYRQVPIGVVLPRDEDDVVAALDVCRGFGAPVLPRGGGTSLAGQCCNVAVVIDTSRHLRQVQWIDAERRVASVQAGVILDDLRRAAGHAGLTFGPDPSTHNHCTLGGMIGNNSCGVHSVLAAHAGRGSRTSDNVQELDVVTGDGVRMTVGPTSEAEASRIVQAGGRPGEIYARLAALADRFGPLIRQRYPRIPRRVSGYNLDELLPERGFNVARALAGSEGTCVTTLGARVHLVPDPPSRVLLVLGYPDVYEAADHVPDVMRHHPSGCEGLDVRLLELVAARRPDDTVRDRLPPGRGWLLVEFGGESPDHAEAQARRLTGALERARRPPASRLLTSASDQHAIWRIRESALGATASVPGRRDTWPGWEDSAVPPDRLGEYLRALRDLLRRYDYDASLYGHFGEGCVHTRIPFELRTADGTQRYRAFVEEAADLVLGLGGSLSGEHGDGQARGALLEKMFGPELVEAFRDFKRIWDPESRMNPGRVVDAGPLDAGLRVRLRADRPEPRTAFGWPDDDGRLSRAALRCVGIGECRRAEGGTMCPSFRVTREERHSTRGRARLLFEMLQGDLIADGWQSEAVRESLDLCLACKGCKGDCPVNVDVATYKAEFLSHYYAAHWRPRSAYAFGLVREWAPLASPVAPVINWLARAPGTGWLARRAAGVARQRDLPALAPQTFRRWVRRRGLRRNGGRRVVLWADTFHDYFAPGPLRAAVDVLEDAGLDVVVPPASLCCGRPLYDYGMLDRARRRLRDILDALASELDAGAPVAVLEPSCLAVFRDELVNVFPDSQDAHRLKRQSRTLAELLQHDVPGYPPPRLTGRALLHGHCHQKAIMTTRPDVALLARMGLEVEAPDTGCCGMAGAFGFEAGHYEVSMAVGEEVLLPAVRGMERSTLLVADGFSCREQVRQATDRRPLHLVEVLDLARRGVGLPAGVRPEDAYRDVVAPESRG